jgi:hypothetical protein
MYAALRRGERTGNGRRLCLFHHPLRVVESIEKIKVK